MITGKKGVGKFTLINHFLTYIYDSSNGKVGVPISIGHKYSAVGYITNDKHWALPVSVKELSIDEKESSFGVRQWLNVVNDSKNRFQDKPSVGLFDAAYSNAYGIDAFIKNKEVINHMFLVFY